MGSLLISSASLWCAKYPLHDGGSREYYRDTPQVFSMLLRKCRSAGFVIPNLPKNAVGQETSYEGATVIEPRKRFYEDPIATLDFASLYPSIMQVL